jgi:hypothetical protein
MQRNAGAVQPVRWPAAAVRGDTGVLFIFKELP